MNVRNLPALAVGEVQFVEVNSTFYITPSIEMVRSWRPRVPDDFMFSISLLQ